MIKSAALVQSVLFGLIVSGNPGDALAGSSEPKEIGYVTVLFQDEQVNLGLDLDRVGIVRKITVDGYPVTDSMLAGQVERKSSLKMMSGQTLSFDKVWFTNDSIQQTLVFELYTDFHRMVTYHFYNNGIPADLVAKIELHDAKGELVSESQKLHDIGGFIEQADRIHSSYFATDKKLRLGDTKQKADGVYGAPDSSAIVHEGEQLEWDFAGSFHADMDAQHHNKPIAENSYGYHVVMYFIKERLVGMILVNYVP
ncbi:MAG: hypothetical protein F9K28_09820 [Bacteroidetes bacterium]|nr:MAG: hypothetical protein F9K28_09820 [Bacteroidota bacterium]MBZ0195107.1 hypothetical protein [Candidatus Kapabacteria bacterium]